MTLSLHTGAPPKGEASPTISLELVSVQRAAAGDARAQAWLVDRVMPAVRRVTRSLAQRTSDADDAAQLALLEVLRSARTFRGLAPLEGWAARIAARVTLRHLAHERQRWRRLIPASHEVEPPDAPGSPDPAGELLPDELRGYLARLPPQQRTTLILRHALGYSIDEIGELTEVSRNTVKGRLRLGAAALRKMMRRDAKFSRAPTEAPR